MSFTKAVYLLLIHLILLLCQQQHSTQAYTHVATSGSSSNGEGPKIYKAVNFDLIFPKSFNSTENVISTTPESIPSPSSESSAIVAQQYYPLPQSNEQINAAVEADTPSDNQQPLYVTPPPSSSSSSSNEADSSYNNRQQNTNDNGQVAKQKQQRLQLKEQQQESNLATATGRAVDYQTSYPFGQLITPLIKNAPRPVYKKPAAASSTSSSNVGKIIYPQAVYQQKPPSQAEIDKLRGKGPFKDRFTPSEGVVSHQLKSNHDHHNHHNHAPSYKPVGKIPSASNVVNSYVAPSNLYSFPPNNIDYPSQTQDNKAALPSGVINSYSPPASGQFKNTNVNLATASNNDSPYKYPGPVHSSYLPAGAGGASNDAKDNGDNDSDLDNGGSDDSVGVLPASAMDNGGNNGNGGDTGDNGDDSGDNNGDDGGDMAGSMDSQDDSSHDHHHHDDHSYDTAKEYPTPPPGWLDDHPHHDHHPDSPDIEFDHDHDHHHHHHQPDIEFDHDHDHHHHPDIVLDHDPHSHHYDYHDSYPAIPYHHSYPELIYDDHHDHIVEHVEPPPTTTTEAPLPEPPPEPRVKKYSYFYIGRKLWYIPLYFTVWFSFYVLWLILKSIARHKVNLPNHYVARRSVENYDFSKTQQETINQLTVSVMDKIENFKRKYLN